MPYAYNPFTGELDRINVPSGGTASIQFDGDSGSATPTAGGVITIAGGNGITTSATGNTLTVTLDTPVSAADGGTGQDTSASTGVPQISGGTWSVSTALANGTTATTQSSGDNSTNVATTAYVDAAGTAAGYVVGPGSATDNAIARYDGTTGKLIQNSGITIDDSDVMSGITQLDVDNVRIDGNTVSTTDTNGSLTLSPDGTGGVIIPTDLTVGNTTQDTSFTVNGAATTAVISMETTNSSDLDGFVTHRHTATAGYGGHTLALRSRGTHSSPTIVSDNDVLSISASAGYDGTDYALAAQINVEVDGTPGSNDMPGRIVFKTSQDGAQTPTEALRIDSSQVLTLANALTVANGGTGATTLTGVLTGNGTSAVTASAVTQHAVLLGGASNAVSEVGPLTNGQLVIGNTGSAPSAATLTAGTGVSITNGAGSITISSGGILGWTEETGTSANLVVNEGVIANNASLVTLTLPTTAALGSIIRIVGKGAGLFAIAQGAGQTIHFGASDTTTGAGGSLTATNQYDAIELVCTVANTDFTVLSSVGSFTVV